MDDEREMQRMATELLLRELLDKERETSDKLYAMRIVQDLVFGMVALILMAVVGALIALVVTTR